MLTKEQILTTLREKYPYLANTFGLKRIGLFGSYVKGTQHEASDIDILAEFEKPIGLKFIEFAEYLEILLGKRTEVITAAGLQGTRNLNIAKSIAETVEYV